MNDDELKRAYATALELRPVEGRARCPSPEALQAVVERTGSESARLTTLDHAMACPPCLRDLELLRAVAAAGAQQGSPAGTGRRWPPAPGLRLAASLALLITSGAAVLLLLRRDGDIMRGAGARNVAIVGPEGAVEAGRARALIWRAVPGALRYQVELLTATGDSVFTVETTDTLVTLPASLTLQNGNEYVWTVRAQLSDGTQAAAAPRRFRITP